MALDFHLGYLNMIRGSHSVEGILTCIVSALAPLFIRDVPPYGTVNLMGSIPTNRNSSDPENEKSQLPVLPGILPMKRRVSRRDTSSKHLRILNFMSWFWSISAPTAVSMPSLSSYRASLLVLVTPTHSTSHWPPGSQSSGS